MRNLFLFQLYITWPFGPKGPNITFSQDTSTSDVIELEYEYLELEPIGLFFLLFFAIVLFIQLVGMLLHRLVGKQTTHIHTYRTLICVFIILFSIKSPLNKLANVYEFMINLSLP